jgi:RNA recognition motif-containing protein
VSDEAQVIPTNILLVSILDARVPVSIDNIHQVFKPYGEVLKIITFIKGEVLKALVQMGSIESAINAKLYLDGKYMFQGCCQLRIGFSKLKDLTVKQNGPRMRDYTQSPDYGMPSQSYLFPSPSFAGGSGFGSSAPIPGVGLEKGAVVLVNNLNPEKMTADKIFMLFGVYGDVMRVKILYNKRESALVQFSTPQQAHLAQLHLNRLSLYGKELNVSISKHGEIQLPRGEQDPETAALTKDYSSSPIHRFRHRTNRMKNINPPSQVLHVANLYEQSSEEELRKLFGQDQRVAPAVQFFKKDRKMAYVKMDSIQDAVQALMKLHNYKLGDKYMRVSFSARDPSLVVDGGDAGGGGDE